ncbi:MAG: GntR family transcriptional regulator [Thermodesulfobacteriota bacterium]
MKKERKGYQTLRVYEVIKRKIITLDLKPGEVLEEKKLAAELGVGRTPVREALLLLKNDNLIESQPNKTAYVREMNLKNIKDLFESLMHIEKLTACLASERITPTELKEIEKTEEDLNKALSRRDFWEIESQNQKFHQLVAQASDNEYLISIHRNLRTQAERLSYLAISKEWENGPALNDHLDKIKEHHKAILRCLKRKNPKSMEKLSVEHVKLFRNRIMVYLQRY